MLSKKAKDYLNKIKYRINKIQKIAYFDAIFIHQNNFQTNVLMPVLFTFTQPTIASMPPSKDCLKSYGDNLSISGDLCIPGTGGFGGNESSELSAHPAPRSTRHITAGKMINVFFTIFMKEF